MCGGVILARPYVPFEDFKGSLRGLQEGFHSPG